MIDKQYGEIIFECDACPETLVTGEKEWADAMSEFRRAGWKAEKIGDEWLYTCSLCRDKK